MRVKNKIYIFIVALFSVISSAQEKRVQTAVDTTKNKIGAQFNLTLRTIVDTTAVVVFPSGTNFGKLEVIRSYVVDTIQKDNRIELVKRYGLTQFDSGKYTIPALRVLIDKKPFFSDSVSVEVANVKVDTLQQKMYDIKPITQVPSTGIGSTVKYILIFLLIAGIGALIYWLLKKSQAKKAAAEEFKTPIQRAASLLETLEKKELWQKGEVKSYYSELTDIARNYIEEAIHIPAMESTTSELIAALQQAAATKNMAVSPEILANLEKVLKQADLVKFAKSKPLDCEITNDREKIVKAIVTLDKAIPEMSEDEALIKESQRQKMLKRQKRNRILITATTVFLLLVGTAGYFIATKGFSYLKDNVLGHPTKELLEGEWILSEYGNPAIVIETPRVLTRLDGEKILPKEAMALFKEFQLFGYGSVLQNFEIGVATYSYQSETSVDLEKGLEGLIGILEAQGAQNVLVKQEKFETREGISGIKAFGTYTKAVPGSDERLKIQYQMLLFGQQNGMQQISISHVDGDNYAEQITQRVLNSVELKTLSN